MFGRLFRSRGLAPLLDQAAVSGGNFFTTLFLARTLVPAEYGTFSLFFLALFALNTCHSSLIVYPLTLRAATASRDELASLTGSAILHTIALSLPLSGCLALIALFLHRLDLVPALIACMLLWQLQETLRRSLLGALRFSDAILPDLFCYVGQAALLVLFRPKSLLLVFLVFAATSLLAGIWQALLLGVTRLTVAIDRAHQSWQMGRFILAGNILNMISIQWSSWILLALSSAVAVADYQSLLSLTGFANPIIFGINSLLIPVIAREEVHGLRHARSTAVRYGARYGLLLLPAFLALFLIPHTMMRLFYGAFSPYLAYSGLLRPLVAAFALQYVATVIGAYEGGLARPKTYMWVQVVSVPILVSLGTLLIWKMGVAGAAATPPDHQRGSAANLSLSLMVRGP